MQINNESPHVVSYEVYGHGDEPRGLPACRLGMAGHIGSAMRKRRTLLIGIPVSVMAIVGLVMVLTREREPEYGGKKLNHYAEMLGSSVVDGRIRRLGMDQPSMDAIRRIGSNATPYLLDWLGYEQPAWKRGFYGTLNSKFGWDLYDKREARAEGALIAFSILGSAAQEAIPGLSRIMNDPKATIRGSRAAQALGRIGKEAVPALLGGLTNRNGTVPLTAWDGLSRMGTNAVSAVPVLIHCLQDTNLAVAHIAAGVLGDLKLQPDLVVPALVKSLQDSRPVIRNGAASALAEFGDSARPAVPALLRQLKDPEAAVRSAVSDALRKIDPKALEKAGKGIN